MYCYIIYTVYYLSRRDHPVPEGREEMTDHPRIRESAVCPFCLEPKNAGLVCCWQCFRSTELSQGNADAEAQLDEREAELAGVAA